MKTFRYAYLHGFASSPRSTKAVELARSFEALGLALDVPDLNRPSFARLDPRAMIEAVDALYASPPNANRPLRLIGSSLGGWLAARYAELHSERVDRVVLLCPAFHLVERWPRLIGEAEFARWERDGELPLPDAGGTPVPVHFGFIEAARREPAEPNPTRPTLILHGTRDETVPVQLSRDYVARHPNVQLVELDDDHRLLASVGRIDAEIQRFFEIGRMTVG